MAQTFKNSKATLANNTATTVYTAPSGGIGVVKTLVIANTTTVAVSATVTWLDNSDSSTSTTLLSAVSIPAYSALNALPAPLFLEASDSVKVASSNSSGYLSVTVSALEIT